METNKYHINYTAEDIQRYLHGEMSPLEMNALEKAALDDPFLAEAIEGYEAMQREQWQPKLVALRSEFSTNTNNEARVVPIQSSRRHWWKYAAAVLITGGAIGSYFYFTQGNKNQAEIASNKIVTKTTDEQLPAATDSAVSISSNSSTTTLNTSTNNTVSNPSKPVISQDNIGVISSGTKTDPVTVNRYDYKNDDLKQAEWANDFKADSVSLAKKELQDNTKLKPTAITPASPQSTEKDKYYADNNTGLDKRSTAAQRKAPLLNQQNAPSANSGNNNFAVLAKDRAVETNRSFMAQVVDKNNNPLPFANINVTNQGFGTYADVRGNVRLISTDSIIPVEVRSLGFGTEIVTLRSNAPNRIVMQEDALAVSEKLEMKGAHDNRGYRKYAPVQDSTSDAEPADGWDNYNTYVLNNTELPDEVLKKNIHGEVEVSFDVKRNGTISNIKVDKSLCTDCDEIAKRLVEQGPQWKLKKGKKAKAKVKVKF